MVTDRTGEVSAAMDRTCLRYSRQDVGYPCIAALARDLSVVADGTGHIRLIDLARKKTLARQFVGAMGGLACRNLRSLRVGPAPSMRVAVATRGGYGVLMDFARQVVENVYPEQGGSVNAVAFSPDGGILALGTGYYPLGGEPQPAHVEIWSLPEGSAPEFVTFAALPGVCVDAIAFRGDGDRIACVTGLRTQNAGYLAQLDASDLRPISFCGAAWFNSDRLCYLGLGDRIASVSGGGFRIVDGRTGSEEWRAQPRQSSADIQDFDYDEESDELVLSDGRVLHPDDGEELRRFRPIKNCTSIAIRPGGGYLGVSSEGRIACWS